MDDKQLIAYPMIEELGYRSNIYSMSLNTMLKSIEESTLRAIIKGGEIENQLSRINLATNVGYLGLNRGAQMYQYYPRDNSIPQGEYGGLCFASAFGNYSGSRQDKLAGIMTMPWSNTKKLSKIPIYNGVLSPSVQIYVDGILRPSDDPVYAILDGDLETFWVETASVGEHTLEIVLPPSINKSFNYIEINPFPIFGLDITKVEYYDNQSVAQEVFATNNNMFFNASTPIKFHLAPKEFNNVIKITFNVIEGINAMGFTTVDICNIDYLNNESTFYLQFENIPKKDHTNNSITAIKPMYIDLDFFVDGVKDSNYSSFFKEISLTKGRSFNDKLLLKKIPGRQDIDVDSFNIQVGSSTDLWLKVTMNEVGFTSPMFRGAKLSYREIV
jgi:hypothetical protein